MTTTTAEPVTWRKNLGFFLATALSVFGTYVFEVTGGTSGVPLREGLVQGAQFAGTLLTILVAHELGHYVAARIHRVPASLPYFIPMPVLSPFGTLGAVIRMRGVIPTRKALLDIGAAGPLAGLAFAIPLYLWGSAHSHFVPTTDGAVQLGESLLVKLLDRLAAPHAPEGMELMLSPVAFGAWGGMFVTMINLLPVAQLDGGHVAYALFGTKQDRYGQLVHRAMLVFFFVALAGHTSRDVAAGHGLYHLGRHIGTSMFWLVWFQVLGILATISRPRDELPNGALTLRVRIVILLTLVVLAGFAGNSSSNAPVLAFFGSLALVIAMEIKAGMLRKNDLLDHPPTGAAPLDRGRAIIAVVTLLFFVLLFMPEPFSM